VTSHGRTAVRYPPAQLPAPPVHPRQALRRRHLGHPRRCPVHPPRLPAPLLPHPSRRRPAPRTMADHPRPPARQPGNPDQGCSARRACPHREADLSHRSDSASRCSPRRSTPSIFPSRMHVAYQSWQIWPRQDPNGSLLLCANMRGCPETRACRPGPGQRLEAAGLCPVAVGTDPVHAGGNLDRLREAMRPDTCTLFHDWSRPYPRRYQEAPPASRSYHEVRGDRG
jgi:hypothetical protein